jgi:hypothetical protein
MASAYGNLGLLHEAAGDLDGGEEMQLRSPKLEEELGRKEGMAISYAGSATSAKGGASSAAPGKCS